ncbi:MAG: hypothetical protein WCA49_07545 [Candidatus Sulfotelmatobacter sp.]
MSDELIAGFGGAILGAIVAGVFAWLQHRSERLAADKAELRRTVSKLVDYEQELRSIMKISDLQERKAADLSLTTKRMIEMENAAVLARNIGDQITTAECLALAAQWRKDTDYTNAEKYYRRAVAAASTKLAKVVALRTLADYYFSPGPLLSVDKGRAHFEEAVKTLGEPTDDPLKFNQGFTFACWASQEMANDFRVQAEDKFDQARKYYKSMAETFPLRQAALDSLQASLDALERGSNASMPPPVISRIQVDHLLQEVQKNSP